MPFSVRPLFTPSAARSKIWSPMATPARGFSFEFFRLKMPNGRFWIGKSQPGAFADSTQLFRSGSCVSSKSGSEPDYAGLSLRIAMRDHAARLHIVIGSAAFPQLPLAEIKPVAQHEAQGLGNAAAGVARQSLEPQPLGGRQGYGAHRFHSSEISAARLRASKSGSDPDFKWGLSPF